MSKTNRGKKPEKELTVSTLKGKLSDRKSQVLRLKRTIKGLEERLEKAGKSKPPAKSGKKKKTPVVKTDIEKLKDAKEELRAKMKEQFGAKDETENND